MSTPADCKISPGDLVGLRNDANTGTDLCFILAVVQCTFPGPWVDIEVLMLRNGQLQKRNYEFEFLHKQANVISAAKP
jgi:hypothetical protein